MKSIVIGKDSVAYAAKIGGGTIAGVKEVNLLADGAVAVFTDKGELVTAANVATILIDKKGVFYAVGSGSATTGAYVTTVTGRLGANYKKVAYVAPVKSKKYIGYDGTTAGTALNLPTLIAGAEAFIKIVDTTKGLRTIGSVYTNEVKSYSYVVKTGDTDTTIVTALVNDINNDPTSVVTAAIVSTSPTLGISLEHKEFGGTFTISLDGILTSATKEEPEGATPGVSVAMKYGEGTYAQILAQEEMYSTSRGNTNKVYQPKLWYSVASMGVVGETYDQYNVSWTQYHNREIGSQATTNQEIIIALPNGATAQATFETIMAQVYGVAEEQESGA